MTCSSRGISYWHAELSSRVVSFNHALHALHAAGPAPVSPACPAPTHLCRSSRPSGVAKYASRSRSCGAVAKCWATCSWQGVAGGLPTEHIRRLPGGVGGLGQQQGQAQLPGRGWCPKRRALSFQAAAITDAGASSGRLRAPGRSSDEAQHSTRPAGPPAGRAAAPPPPRQLLCRRWHRRRRPQQGRCCCWGGRAPMRPLARAAALQLPAAAVGASAGPAPAPQLPWAAGGKWPAGRLHAGTQRAQHASSLSH